MDEICVGSDKKPVMGRIVANVNNRHVRIHRFAVKGKNTVSARVKRVA